MPQYKNENLFLQQSFMELAGCGCDGTIHLLQSGFRRGNMRNTGEGKTQTNDRKVYLIFFSQSLHLCHQLCLLFFRVQQLYSQLLCKVLLILLCRLCSQQFIFARTRL